MLYSLNTGLGYKVAAQDGDCGRINDFLLDDRTWMLRYAVVDTGTWLPGRRVLLSPESIEALDVGDETVTVNIRRAQIEAAPELGTDEPVSRQYEHYLYEHYRWNPYWVPGFAGGMIAPIVAAELAAGDRERIERAVQEGDPHLRSVKELCGYGVHTEKEAVGSVSDLLYHDDSGGIPYLVVDVGGWFNKEPRVVPVSYVKAISFREHTLQLYLSTESLETMACFEPDMLGSAEPAGASGPQ
jgi:hypothetical protein